MAWILICKCCKLSEKICYYGGWAGRHVWISSYIYTYFRPMSLQCIASAVRPHIFSYIVSSVIVVFLCWQLTTVGACYGWKDSWTSTPRGGVLVPYIPYMASSFPPHSLYGVLTSSSLHRRHPHFLLSSPSLVLVENSAPGWPVVFPSLPPWKCINKRQRPWFKYIYWLLTYCQFAISTSLV